MNPFLELTNNLTASKPLIEENRQKETLILHTELEEKISNRVLQVMLYGAYNAGKSTLVNTLLGRYEAKENDIPTTDSVDTFDWNGFHLLDTPGINAPIAHEYITQEQVKRSGAMLFVIREGDQDSKNLYERLFEMIKLDKKIFIVLNHQLTSLEDKIIALKKINHIISMLAPDYSISNEQIGDISILPMNIRTAYKGRVNNHKKLLEHSGYNSFIHTFTQWITLQDKKQRHLEILKNQVDETWYKPVIDNLDKLVNIGESKEFRTLRDNRLMLENKKRSINSSAVQFISQKVNLLKIDVSNALSNSDSEVVIDSKLQQIFMPLPNIVEDWLGNELAEVSGKLTVSIDKNAKIRQNDTFSNNFNDTIYNGAKDFLTDQKNLKEALLFGRKLKIPGLKGRWGKTFDKWAGKAAPAIQVVTFLYDLYKADTDQDKENQQSKQHSMELYQCVEQICSTVLDDMIQSVQSMIDFTFDYQIQEIQAQLDNESQKSGKEKDRYNKLIELRDKMHSINF